MYLVAFPNKLSLPKVGLAMPPQRTCWLLIAPRHHHVSWGFPWLWGEGLLMHGSIPSGICWDLMARPNITPIELVELFSQLPVSSPGHTLLCGGDWGGLVGE